MDRRQRHRDHQLAQRLHDVAWGNGRFVAAGSAANGGTILHSVVVAHGGTHFIAIGLHNDPPSSKIVRSADGATWEQASDTDFDGYLEDVAYGANRFVAVGGAGQIIHSPDGSHWTAAASSTAAQLNGVASNGTHFVAVGNNGTILTSP